MPKMLKTLINPDNLSSYARDRELFRTQDGELLDVLPIYDILNSRGELLGRVRRDMHTPGSFHFIAILPSGNGKMFDRFDEAVEFLREHRVTTEVYPIGTWDVYRVLELKATGEDEGGPPKGSTWYAHLL